MWQKRRLAAKILLLFAFSAIILELILQFYADSGTNRYSSAINSFEQFMSSLQKSGIPPAHIYFVGDSTIFGSGASIPHLYSLPAQLERLFKELYPEFKIVNLGYPATCTEDHLRIMSFLPVGSTIVYRGGISDAWNKGGQFRLTFFGRTFEFRILKMAYMLFAPIFIQDADNRSLNVRRRMLQILDQKKFNIFTVDYSIGSEFPFLYTQDQRIRPIHLRYLLDSNGFFADGDLKKEYVSMNTRNHPNDLGHYLEAIFVFNYFCQEGLFGLTKEQELPLSKLSEFSGNLISVYEDMKDNLRQIKTIDLGRLFHLVPQVIAMSSLLCYQQSVNQELYTHENDMLERISLLVLHDPSRITTFLMSSQNEHVMKVSGQKPNLAKMELYQAVLRATAERGSDKWEYVHESLKNSQLPLTLRNPSYLPDISPYPLELCPRFSRETGFSVEELSIQKEWEYFFSIPFQFFLDEHRYEQLCR